MSDVQHAENRTAIPLFDLQRQHRALRNELVAALTAVCDSTQFIMGPPCQILERRLAEYCQARHAIGCASGSDALLLALLALEIGSGDEVLVPSYTFFATASAVWRLGAKPVFVDIEPNTFNIDAERLGAHINRQTKAIIAVHLFGQCADMRAIGAVAARHGLPVIEDAAQAIGAEFDGRRAGSLGDVACFSFYPTKNLGGGGDGGLLTTGDDKLAAKLRLLRSHGMEPRYHHQLVGVNSRLDSLQAALLNVKLDHLDRLTARRRANADRYEHLFALEGLSELVTPPAVAPARRHVWNQYVIRVSANHRDPLRAHLAAQKIGTEIYYPLPLHLQPCFASLGYRAGSLPETERAARETIALPIFPELEPEEQEIVVSEIGRYFRGQPAIKDRGVPRPKYLGKEGAGKRVG